ncbi:hypothetical protein [uncultured Flavobacterium sp.]|uniref:hypothetical protein n=1 Tax=uncultured Flavobacterium sp. TaxID=165435 RepID=UPI00292EEEA3|nr:hypothetical protein [uncultured Flavobacterium sp.]
MSNPVETTPFSSNLKEQIKTLNIEWLQKYFRIEEKDEHVLSNPQQEIINKDGVVFYAKHNDEIIGTASLMKSDNNTFELSKMAASDRVKGLEIGNNY